MGMWRITTINYIHNHVLNADTALFAQEKLRMTPEMLQRVKFYAEAKLGLANTLKLLRNEWQSQTFMPRHVANAIQSESRTPPADISQAAQLLLLLTEEKAKDSRWTIRWEADHSNGQLQRLFWMNPDELDLYVRYHDVVINDNTAKTNRFNMPLNTFVVVDTHNRSRQVAHALLSGETTQDYEWVIECLLDASNQLAPLIMFVDEDVGMEAACENKLPHTYVMNCIWHLGSLNLAKNLKGTYGNRWSDFAAQFWRARNALTEEEFDHHWSTLERDYVGEQYGEQSASYLARLYNRRQRWAWAWIGSRFTAGIQSTQRVEKIQQIIKREVNSQTSLPDLFTAIEHQISNEELISKYLNYKSTTPTSGRITAHISKLFSDVEEVNSRYLGTFGINRMRREMLESMFYRANGDTETILSKVNTLVTIYHNTD